MASHESAVKAHRQNLVKREANRQYRSRLRGALRAIRVAIDSGDPAKMKDQWDIYDPLGAVPAANEDMESIAPPKDGTCKIGA